MSAWIVSKAHIDALVQSMIVERVISPADANDVGRELWRENLRSVAYRYPNDGDGERPGPIDFRDSHVEGYRFAGIEAPLDELCIWKQTACYDYESCEHPDYLLSEACNHVSRLADRIAARHGLNRDEWDRALPKDATGHDPYPWGLDTIEQAIARVPA